MDTLADIHGDRRLVVEADGGIRCTYQQARKRVNRWAGGIAHRTEPGQRVVIAAANSYESFLLCLAASRAGTIPVPLNPQMRPDEVAHVRRDSGASLVIRRAADVDLRAPLTDPHPTDPGDSAALFYTSGTTGIPKGVELTHTALVGQVAAGAAWPSALHRDEAVVSLPIAHIMGFVSLLGLACAGIPVYHLPNFRPDEVLDAIEARRSTMFVGVPAMYRMMIEAGAEDYDLSSVRVWGAGADVMPADLALRFKRMGASVSLPLVGSFGEAIFMEGYGMVEVGGGVAAKLSPPLLPVGLGESLGFALPSCRLKVVDEGGDEVETGAVGELWVRGPGVLKGYWNAPEATGDVVTADGWLRTGDLARRGPFGTVAFVGRQKDVIMHGGYSVYAREVEQALEEHPAVLEAAVLGRPDDRLGEVPVAALRLDDDAADGPDEIADWLVERLADYKVPRDLVVVADLPRTSTNKVQKAELRPLFA
jgi:acyl-CoA synthetase (AMP-forming)/AMP-acid ligase II